jgi:tetratricopeptide (TPR) repeat protein
MAEYNFLWKGKDADGNSRSTKVRADSAQAARAKLTEQGWTDLELMGDEVCSVASAGVRTPDWMNEEPPPVEVEAQFFEGKGPGFLTQWLTSLKDSWLALLICGGLLAWGIHRGGWITTSLGALGLAFFVLLAPAIHLLFAVPLKNYARLNRAKVWARWEEVLDCVQRLRRSHRFTRVGIGEVELSRCRSQALAGLGRLDEGVAEFRSWDNSPELPHWMYLSQLSSIYDTAKAYEKSLECRTQAAAEKPDSSAVWIDLAYGLARSLNRPAEARQALARAEQLEITGIGKNYLPFLRGIIFWREGNFHEAKIQCELAITRFQNQQPQNELLEGLVLLSKAYLCPVKGALGDRTGAQGLFREVETFLLANREQELLDACRRHLPG